MKILSLFCLLVALLLSSCATYKESKNGNEAVLLLSRSLGITSIYSSQVFPNIKSIDGLNLSSLSSRNKGIKVSPGFHNINMSGYLPYILQHSEGNITINILENERYILDAYTAKGKHIFEIKDSRGRIIGKTLSFRTYINARSTYVFVPST